MLHKNITNFRFFWYQISLPRMYTEFKFFLQNIAQKMKRTTDLLAFPRFAKSVKET